MINTLRKNVANVLGWRTNRKLLIIESDDWGSVQTRDKEAFKNLQREGLNVESIHYTAFDSLESNEDLEMLFDVLRGVKDKYGNCAKFTPMCIMGNPDFEKIIENDYKTYFFQPLKDTLKNYPQSDQILNLWSKGAKENIFTPELHGREHINARRYLDILKNHKAKLGLRLSAQNHSVGSSTFRGEKYPNYLGALYPETSEEIGELKTTIRQAGEIFEEYMGYKPRVFMAPNAEEPREMELVLKQIGVKYLTRSKRRIYPKGDGRFGKEWNFIGKINQYDQLILNRNAFFEPVCFGEHEHISNWVESCLNDIDIAFKWNKPAVVSAHRVNFTGSIDPSNRDRGLSALQELLNRVVQNWPNVEFMTSAELGDTIRKDKEKRKYT